MGQRALAAELGGAGHGGGGRRRQGGGGRRKQGGGRDSGRDGGCDSGRDGGCDSGRDGGCGRRGGAACRGPGGYRQQKPTPQERSSAVLDRHSAQRYPSAEGLGKCWCGCYNHQNDQRQALPERGAPVQSKGADQWATKIRRTSRSRISRRSARRRRRFSSATVSLGG
ncbi:hypothetical protein F8S13_08715 [Chloroflexia bacterium SDU3-3]|nr:hypothetical protein F8S13_08715 [Chloroflexia bacterium SDU3-3]